MYHDVVLDFPVMGGADLIPTMECLKSLVKRYHVLELVGAAMGFHLPVIFFAYCPDAHETKTASTSILSWLEVVAETECQTAAHPCSYL